MATGAGPGWYPDPRGGDGLRYWTGDSWAPDEPGPPQQHQQPQQTQQPENPQHSPWAPGGQETWGSPANTTDSYAARQPETLGYPVM